MNFRQSPLLTPARLDAGVSKAFETLPEWATFAHNIADGDDPADAAFAIVVGKTHLKGIVLSTGGLALACEITRFGHSVVTNTNGYKAQPKLYTKLAFEDAPKDNIPLGRILAGADEREAVKALEIESDLRPWNLYKVGAGKPDKEARWLVLKHCRRLAQDAETAGRMPAGLSVAAYIENLEALFAYVDRELEGAAGGFTK